MAEQPAGYPGILEERAYSCKLKSSIVLYEDAKRKVPTIRGTAYEKHGNNRTGSCAQILL
ncbi:MAG TPA: hypothetical protein VHL77_02975 [Ferruginibacter sp.]|nr:hypothetical protein [Ferruginibacter sp.]